MRKVPLRGQKRSNENASPDKLYKMINEGSRFDLLTERDENPSFPSSRSLSLLMNRRRDLAEKLR